VPLAEEAQAEAARGCGQCHSACVALSAACGEFRSLLKERAGMYFFWVPGFFSPNRLLLKEWVASADEYEKREKARRGLAELSPLCFFSAHRFLFL